MMRSISRHVDSLVEIAGLVLLVAGVFLAFGVAWAFMAAGVVLLLLSLAFG